MTDRLLRPRKCEVGSATIDMSNTLRQACRRTAHASPTIAVLAYFA